MGGNEVNKNMESGVMGYGVEARSANWRDLTIILRCPELEIVCASST